MKSLHFGNAFPIFYNRRTGPKSGEDHLSPEPVMRQFQEAQLEGKAGERIVICAEAVTGLQAQLYQSNHGDYLLTNGPHQDTLNIYNQLLAQTPQKKAATPQSFDKTFERAEAIETQMVNRGLLSDESPIIEIDYSVRKNKTRGSLYPQIHPNCLQELRKLFRTLLLRVNPSS